MDFNRFIRISQMIILPVNIVAIIVFFFVVADFYKADVSAPFKTTINDISQCQNLSLKDSAICLRDWESEFYNYTIRDDTIKSLDDIKQNGGDCFDYNENLYVNAGDTLGFNMTTSTMHIGDSLHVITIMSNEEGYCILDQINNPSCYSTVRRDDSNESKV